MVDSTYQQIAEVQAGNGFPGADLQEVLITPRGTACFIIYNPVIWNLASVGGPSTGTVIDSIIQEIEIVSGRVVFEWHSLDHIGLNESIVDPPEDASQAFDYAHVNSVELDEHDDFVVSARNTSAVFTIDRLSGDVAWRLNGTHSDFDRGANTITAYHHDARLHPMGTLTLFDNASADEDSGMQSRVIALELDTETMTATLLSEYTHPTNILSVSPGNMQVLPNGNRVIGWGSAPVFSEFSANGALLFNGRFPQFINSYRAYRFPSVGTPVDAPALAATRRSAGSVTLFASWNGATEVASWRLLAGVSPDLLQPLDVVARDGFETRATVRTSAQYFAARALDSSGQELGISATIQAEA